MNYGWEWAVLEHPHHAVIIWMSCVSSSFMLLNLIVEIGSC